MTNRAPYLLVAGTFLLGCLLLAGQPLKADESKPAGESASGEKSEKKETPKYPPFADVTKEAKPSSEDSLIRMWQKGEHLYAELTSSHLNKDYIVLISIARGIGERPLLGGMTWGFGDDWLWQFRKVDDRIHVVRRNVRFTADKGSPEEQAVKLAYTDSVLFSLPIITKGPRGGDVVDFGQVFMSDLPQISQVLPGFSFASNKSTYEAVKGFKDNVEIQVTATYASGGNFNFDSVADSRGVTLGVHYSISQLPQNSYKPRLADDRVGYFLTVIKDYSKKGDDDQFVRYINRWHLEKADSSAELSPPKQPIRFYIEKTVPYQYRKPVRDGILEWNKAFEKAGFVDAIHVIQQREEETWDPEDINYNTFRWITASAGFAMGPSRVNPTTGQILDADIIFDADFVRFWKQEYENFSPDVVAQMTGGALDLQSYEAEQKNIPPHLRHHALCKCDLHNGLSRELALGSAMITAMSAAPNKEMEEKMLMQGLKEVTMHEVGHTLGLRHNFKASTLYSLDELKDSAKTDATGLTASVMDYNPAHIVPKGEKQGDFFSTTVGPYDIWAIEYGYKVFSGNEAEELKKIASRCAAPELAYATDEDTRGIDSDPLSNRYDMGKEPLEYAKFRAQLIGELWPDLLERSGREGEGYQRVRRTFGVLLGNYGQSMWFASRYIGGVHVNRDHKGDPDERAPFVVVDVNKQREALEVLEKQVFNDEPFKFPPELYNHLAASRWSHWGASSQPRVDFAVHDVIGMWQDRILQQMLSSLTLTRLHDSELKIAEDEDALTTPELFSRLTKAIYAEVDTPPEGEFTDRKPAISSLRRNLQRMYFERLARIAMGQPGTPADSQTVAYLELEDLGKRIDKALEGDAQLDTYTRAHLRETSSRINKVLDAGLQLARP